MLIGTMVFWLVFVLVILIGIISVFREKVKVNECVKPAVILGCMIGIAFGFFSVILFLNEIGSSFELSEILTCYLGYMAFTFLLGVFFSLAEIPLPEEVPSWNTIDTAQFIVITMGIALLISSFFFWNGFLIFSLI